MTSAVAEPRRITTPGAPTPDGEGGSLVWLAAILLRDRRTLVLWSAVGLLIGLGVALFQRPLYTSSFSFLPQASQDANRAGLASLAGQFGISLGALTGNMPPPQLYADLVVTRGVLAPIANGSFRIDAGAAAPVPLARFLKVKGADSALVLDKVLRKLRKDVVATSVAGRTTGMITVYVRTRSADVSLAIAEQLLRGLNDFNVNTRQSQAREERRFSEERYAVASSALRAAEDALQQFSETNRQYQNSPTLSLQRERLQREVVLRQQVVTTLAQQLEDARIREVRDTPVISVVETPVRAAKPDSRGRLLILALSLIAGLAIGVLLVLVRDQWQRTRSSAGDPAVALLMREWNRLRRRPVE